MKITFTKEAQQRISNYFGKEKQLLLDYDDGVEPFSMVGSCSLDNGYRLLFVNPQLALPDFDQVVESNIGPIRIKGGVSGPI